MDDNGVLISVQQQMAVSVLGFNSHWKMYAGGRVENLSRF